jgi:flagellum-specific ATP synthase
LFHHTIGTADKVVLGDAKQPYPAVRWRDSARNVVLDRAIAERGRYPAINILKSVSRSLPGCNSAAENALIGRARRLLAVYEDMAELIRLGAYRKGTDPEVDEAIRLYPKLEAFLGQGNDERSTLADSYEALARILSGAPADRGSNDVR